MLDHAKREIFAKPDHLLISIFGHGMYGGILSHGQLEGKPVFGVLDVLMWLLESGYDGTLTLVLGNCFSGSWAPVFWQSAKIIEEMGKSDARFQF